MLPRPRPVLLMVLDGFGERQDQDANAVRQAHTPAMDQLFASYGHTLIGASGLDVGLPEGQMGNSEVGHLSLGAGRIAKMDITRIDDAVADGSLLHNPAIAEAVAFAKAKGGVVHLLGLVSDGGVHSSLNHLIALIAGVQAQGVSVRVHAFTDGRDTAPGSAPGFLGKVEAVLSADSRVATVSGRFYAMDRDNRWERVQRAFRAIAYGAGPIEAGAQQGLAASFEAGKSDEFVVPFVVEGYTGVDSARDAALHFNFRPDRARELTHALTQDDFVHFPRTGGAPFVHFACMTQYDAQLAALPVAYPKQSFPNTLPEILAQRGLTQFRCAETEKYAHVTYFFNGGLETPFAGEERKLVPSPKDVETYDLKPQMSAGAVTDAVVAAIESDRYDFVLVNFANPDMVGHTGDLNAAVRAVEAVDAGIARIWAALNARGGALVLTADHGNCETMIDEFGNPHTAHTLNPVPLLVALPAGRRALREGGRLGDVAPTVLELMQLPKPAEMTGQSLLLP